MEKLPSLVEYGFRRAFITLIAIICTILPVMNISTAYVAFSDIKGNFGVSLDEVSWVSTAYSLAMIAIMPISSWLSWQLGRKNYFFIAVIVFTVSSFFCGNAADLRGLIICRFLLGLGGGGMLVLSHTIITESWPLEKRASSQAFFMLGILAGGMIGPPVGGYITDNYSWPFIFFVNIPAGIIACLLILSSVKSGSYEKTENWTDIIRLTAGTSLLYIILARGEQEGWFNGRKIVILSQIGLVGIVLFFRLQLVFKSLPRETRLLRNGNLRTGLILSLLTSVGLVVASIAMASLPGLNTQVSTTPLWVTSCVIVVMIMVAAVLIERGETLKYVIVAGLLCFTFHSCLLYRIESGDTGSVYVYMLFITRGLALALLAASISTLALSKLEGKQIVQGVVLYNIIQQLGGTLGRTLFSFFFHAGYSVYILILTMAVVLLVCIPFVLYYVENKSSKEDQ